MRTPGPTILEKDAFEMVFPKPLGSDDKEGRARSMSERRGSTALAGAAVEDDVDQDRKS